MQRVSAAVNRGKLVDDGCIKNLLLVSEAKRTVQRADRCADGAEYCWSHYVTVADVVWPTPQAVSCRFRIRCTAHSVDGTNGRGQTSC